MSTGSNLTEVFLVYVNRLRSHGSQNAEGFEQLLTHISQEQMADLIYTSCLACCRLENNTRFAEAVASEALTLERSDLKSSSAAEATVLRGVADRLHVTASIAAVGRVRRPTGSFGTPAGAALVAVEDAHVGMRQEDQLAALLAKGDPGDDGKGRGKGTQGQPSPGVANLLALLLANGTQASRADLTKAIRNTRSKRKRRKI